MTNYLSWPNFNQIGWILGGNWPRNFKTIWQQCLYLPLGKTLNVGLSCPNSNYFLSFSRTSTKYTYIYHEEDMDIGWLDYPFPWLLFSPPISLPGEDPWHRIYPVFRFVSHKAGSTHSVGRELVTQEHIYTTQRGVTDILAEHIYIDNIARYQN